MSFLLFWSLRALSADSSAIGSPAGGALPQEPRHPVELIGLSENGRLWRASGDRKLEFSMVDFRAPTQPGWRRLVLAFRVKNASALVEQAFGATVWSKYAYPSDDLVFREAYRADEKIAYCTIRLRRDVKIAKLGVDLMAGPWRMVADATPGSGLHQAKVMEVGTAHGSEKRAYRTYEVTFNGQALPGREAYSELIIEDDRGRSRITFAGALPLGTHGGYIVSLPRDERPGHFTLRSRTIEHFRFDAVRLWPNP